MLSEDMFIWVNQCCQFSDSDSLSSNKFGVFLQLWQPPKLTIHRIVNNVTSALPSALALTYVQSEVDVLLIIGGWEDARPRQCRSLCATCKNTAAGCHSAM